MIANKKRSTRGTSTTIGALIVVGLIGFAVFALNGGMIFLQKQGAQQAVEAASLAGALALTQGYDLEQTEYIVLERAKNQGFDSMACLDISANCAVQRLVVPAQSDPLRRPA